MSEPGDYARQSAYSDPGPYAGLLDALPHDVRGLTTVVRNVLVHYRAAGLTFAGERLAEIDNRWVDRILATDQRRFAAPLSVPRPKAERVAGCCRDFTLLTVAALRNRGVPARSRVGFGGYFGPDFHHDHVVAEYWNGDRWVFVDAELEAVRDGRFDPCDMPVHVGSRLDPRTPFATAAQAWTAFRRGDIDAGRYGVDPHLPYRGGWFLRNYVLQELAHRQRDELLLWDLWGAMAADLSGDLGLVDDVAALLLAADGGSDGAEQELAGWYAGNPALHPADQVLCASPSGAECTIDLRTREHVAGA